MIKQGKLERKPCLNSKPRKGCKEGVPERSTKGNHPTDRREVIAVPLSSPISLADFHRNFFERKESNRSMLIIVECYASTVSPVT